MPSKVEVIEDSNLIREGMYAIAKDGSTSTAYLIVNLKFADRNLHAVVLKAHPRNCTAQHYQKFEYLLDDFYSKYDVISQADGEKIREREIAEIQGRISFQESTIDDLGKNPQKLQQIAFQIYSKRISSPNTPFLIDTTDIAGLLGSQNAVEQIHSLKSQFSRASDIAKIQSQYIAEEVAKLEKLIESLTPYIKEKFICSIASTNEIQSTVGELNDGIATLEMFTGEGVEWFYACQGEPAPNDVKVSLVQAPMYADIELAYFHEDDAEHLDANKIEMFWKELEGNKALVDQIFPTERCVVVMAIRESSIDYKEDYYNIVMDRLNKETFLLVRNGENVAVVYSPIGSHLAAKNLFPSKDSLDQHFLTWRGQDIDINSLNYSDALSAVEKEVLHYKRFLILLAGLQIRENLLGQFHPESETFNIFFPEFQNKYFNFIHDQDGEGLIGGVKEPSLFEILANNKRQLRKGSLILCANHLMINRHTAPGCYRYSWGTKYNDGYNQIRKAIDAFGVAEVQQDKDGYFIKVACKSTGWTYHDNDRTFNVKVAIDEIDAREREAYIVLEGLSVAQLEYYLKQRQYRSFYVKYARLFKKAISWLTAYKADHSSNYNYLNNLVQHFDLPEHISSHEIESEILKAIGFFSRCKNPNEKALEYLSYKFSELKKVSLVLLLRSAQHSLDQEIVCASMGLKGEVHIYTTMPKAMHLNVCQQHNWLYRYTAKNFSSIKFNDPEIVNLFDYMRTELIAMVLNQKLYDAYADNSDVLQYKSHWNHEGIKPVHKNQIASYESAIALNDAFEQSKQLIQAFVSNQVTRDMALSLYPALMHHKKYYDHREGDTWPLLLPYAISKGSFKEIYNVVIVNGMAWLENLCNRYMDDVNQDCTLLDQNNLVDYAFTINHHQLEVKETWQEYFFSYKSAKVSGAPASSKLLSYVFRESHNDFTKFSFCIFEERHFNDLTCSLDQELSNSTYDGNTYPFMAVKLQLNKYRHADGRRTFHEDAIVFGTQDRIKCYVDRFNVQADAWVKSFGMTEDFEANYKVIDLKEYIFKADDLDWFKDRVKRQMGQGINTIESKSWEWDALAEVYALSNITAFTINI